MLNFIVSLALSIYGALVVKHGWGWFIVPLGVPAIGLLHAWGIRLIISVLWYSTADVDYINNMNDDDRLKLMFSCGFYAAALHLTMFLLSLGM